MKSKIHEYKKKSTLVSKKTFPFLVLLFLTNVINAQVDQKQIERFPVFPSCENLQYKPLETCFYNEVQDFVYNNFKVPENLKQNNFKGNVIVLLK